MTSTDRKDGAIRVVDFGKFLDGSQKQEVADAILDSFKEIGFVYLINYGLTQQKIASIFETSKDFFSQPMDIKLLAPHPASGSHHRGYSAPGVEKVLHRIDEAGEIAKHRAAGMDVKESFECGREDNPVMPNIWPPEEALPGFRQACMDYYWAFRGVELNILRALALAFHLPVDYFCSSHESADNQLRLLHYPSVLTEDLNSGKITRIGAHSDFGSITLLVQDSVGGLEIEDPNNPGEFLSVPPVEGGLIVNAGDFLARWSNDIIRSTIHRVRAPPNSVSKDGMTQERYSIPYFCAPDFNTVVDCIPGTFSEERPKKYEAISSGQYILQRLAANY
ncbi:thymine dioxygenase [Trametopsis cervina]|nr:thymine dioxygenase [Trametopsis cervina]